MTLQRTLSIGGGTYDLFVRTGLEHETKTKAIHLPLGKKIRVQEVLERGGGGAANTSVGLRRQGFDAGFSGVIGSDQWGTKLLDFLKQENVDTSSITQVEGEMTSFSLILTDADGERVILYTPGTNTHLHDTTFDKAAAFGCDWIYLNHIAEESSEIIDDLLQILSGENSPGLTWNPGGFHLKLGMQDASVASLLQETNLLFLNKEEAQEFTGEESIEAALMKLKSAGVKYPCITDGSKGAYATDGEMLYFCPPIEDVHVIDTTGAGDAFGTGATAALLRGSSLPEMLRSGTINATSVLGHIGAQNGLLTDTELTHRLASTKLLVDAKPISPNSHVR